MGVFRLETIMKKLDAVDRINLRDAANDWRAKGGNPAIVLDCLNFASKFYGNDENRRADIICNGEYKKIAKAMKTFIQAFKDVSIDLVFFIDGPVDERKLKTWIKRRQGRLDDFSRILERIKTEDMSQLVLDVFPCMILPVMKEALREENCIVERGVDDHDKEMAKYVVDNNCLGILSDDTDFVVFENIPNVFSARNLNLQNMTTTVTRRLKFINAINLSSEAMPVLATLMGNDHISRPDAQAYSHRKCGSSYLKNKDMIQYAQVANSIHAQSRNKEETARTLAREIFQSDNNWETVFDSLCSYDLETPDVNKSDTESSESSHWDVIVTRCLEKFKEGSVENQTLSIIKRQLCSQSEKFESLENSHVDVLKGLRQRIYSLLLHEKLLDGGTVTVTEIIAGGSNSLKRTPVQTLKVEVEHPGVLKLWNSGKELDDRRWELIWWALRSAEDHGEALIPFDTLLQFHNLSHHLMIVGLALLYLHRVVKQLNEKELTVLMVLVTSVEKLDAAQLSRNQVKRTTERAATLSTLFMQTYSYVRWVMDICALQLDAKWRDAYSGQLFHYLFQLEDPTQFFEQSGAKALDNYNKLRSAFGLPQDETSRVIPVEPRILPEISDEQKEQERAEEDQKTDDHVRGDSRYGCKKRRLEGGREQTEEQPRERQQNRENTVKKQRFSEDRFERRNRNYSPGFFSGQQPRRFNDGWRRGGRGRGRPWHRQEQKNT